jgi:hypothetical protein
MKAREKKQNFEMSKQLIWLNWDRANLYLICQTAKKLSPFKWAYTELARLNIEELKTINRISNRKNFLLHKHNFLILHYES